WLDGKHTVFGHVVSGQDVVNAIKQDDIMEKITIIRVGKDAKKFDATAVFNKIKNEKEAELLKESQEIEKVSKMTTEEYKTFMYQEVLKNYPNAKQSESGLVYVIENEGSGEEIKA